jgi:hypothetical protein
MTAQKPKLLTSVEICELYKMPYTSFMRAWKQIPDFPRPIPGLHRLKPKWDKDDVVAWLKNLPADTKPITIFRQARCKMERPALHTPRPASEPAYIDPTRKLSLDFLRGNFATQQQQDSYNQKRAHARRVKPKTTVVTVASQW